ncbi:hypothetical protein GEMRC1_003024 [Eukaryota sp. GEM-RC1]
MSHSHKKSLSTPDRTSPLSDTSQSFYEAKLASFQELLSQVQVEYESLLKENILLKKKISHSSSSTDHLAPQYQDSVLEIPSPTASSAFASTSVSDSSYTTSKWRAISSKLFVRNPSSTASFYTPSTHYQGHCDGIQHTAVSYPSFSSTPYLAVSSLDTTVTIWDTTSNTPAVAIIDHHTGAVNSVVFHDLSPLLLTASGDCTVCLWPLSSHELEQRNDTLRITDPFLTLTLPSVAYSSVFLFSDVVASSCWNGSIYVHTVSSTSSPRTLSGHTAEVLKLSCFSFDNSTCLLSASNG